MVNTQYERAKNILKKNEEGHRVLAELLIRREVIFAEDVEKIFGKRPWISRSQEIMGEDKPQNAEDTATQGDGEDNPETQNSINQE